MTDYSIILVFSFIIPFLFSFERKIFFIKKIKNILGAIFITCTPYIVWDIIFTKIAVWKFSEDKVSNFDSLIIPIEEFLFFICIPYALIFVYEVINFYLPDSQLKFNFKFALFSSFIFMLLSILSYPRIYSSIQFLITSILFFFIWIKKLEIFLSRNLWLFIFLSFIFFFIVNYFLTSIPIVQYDAKQIIGLKITSIPLEDFFYHFTFISLLIINYESLKKKK